MAPGPAYTVNKPSLAFDAPQTTFSIFPEPISTSHNFNLSAFGCFSALIIFATKKKLFLSADPTFSTSSPILFKVETIFSRFALVFK